MIHNCSSKKNNLSGIFTLHPSFNTYYTFFLAIRDIPPLYFRRIYKIDDGIPNKK